MDTNKMTVLRNGVEAALSEFKIIRGDRKDTVYPAPKVEAGSWDMWVKWLGVEYVLGVVQTALKRDFQSLYLDNLDETTGLLNVPKFLVEAAELTAVSAKLSELKDRYDELVAEQCNLIESFDPTNVEQVKRITELGTSIKVVKSQMDQKSRKQKVEIKTEASVSVG